MFRGREMSHRELGQKVLQRVIEDLREVAVIESAPRVEGRQMFMILAPNPRMLQASRDRARALADKLEKAGGAGAPAPAAEPAPEQAPEPAPAPAAAAPEAAPAPEVTPSTPAPGPR
jgi:translation initiation factor IF-3